MRRLEGKVALITGGTSGIGRAVGINFAREGAKIVVTGPVAETQGGNVTVETIAQEGGEAMFLTQDVRVEEDWQRVVNATLERFGRIDILDNNAGEAIMKPIEVLTVENYQFQMRTNIEGTFLGLKYGVPAMEKTGGGSVINMSSATGLRGSANGTTSYCPSKGGVLGLTKAAALEGRDSNVRVNSIHPGIIWGPGMIESLGHEGAFKFRERMLARTPMRRVGDWPDIVHLALFLASDDSRHVTGGEFVIDGGYMVA